MLDAGRLRELLHELLEVGTERLLERAREGPLSPAWARVAVLWVKAFAPGRAARAFEREARSPEMQEMMAKYFEKHWRR